MKKVLPEAANYHITLNCNMSCRFCFKTFDDIREEIPKGSLPLDEALKLVRALAEAGVQKLTLAGGEPLLYPQIDKIFSYARRLGLTTGLVTNGALLSPRRIETLESVLDWVGLSFDSALPERHAQLGRAVHGRPLSLGDYLELSKKIRGAGMRLKVNTVVTRLNLDEDLTPVLTEMRPERWKLLQVLAIEGQNTGKVESLEVSAAEFGEFVRRQRASCPSEIDLIAEDNETMRESYVIVDPRGRFVDNSAGRMDYSAPILELGAERAWAEVNFSRELFLGRKGQYDWARAVPQEV